MYNKPEQWIQEAASWRYRTIYGDASRAEFVAKRMKQLNGIEIQVQRMQPQHPKRYALYASVDPRKRGGHE